MERMTGPGASAILERHEGSCLGRRRRCVEAGPSAQGLVVFALYCAFTSGALLLFMHLVAGPSGRTVLAAGRMGFH